MPLMRGTITGYGRPRVADLREIPEGAWALRGERGLTNLRGALITMPHKISVMDLVDELTPTARVAGACNAVLRRPDGRFRARRAPRERRVRVRDRGVRERENRGLTC